MLARKIQVVQHHGSVVTWQDALHLVLWHILVLGLWIVRRQVLNVVLVLLLLVVVHVRSLRQRDNRGLNQARVLVVSPHTAAHRKLI
jgi:hypothetical protein